MSILRCRLLWWGFVAEETGGLEIVNRQSYRGEACKFGGLKSFHLIYLTVVMQTLQRIFGSLHFINCDAGINYWTDLLWRKMNEGKEQAPHPHFLLDTHSPMEEQVISISHHITISSLPCWLGSHCHPPLPQYRLIDKKSLFSSFLLTFLSPQSLSCLML